MFLTIVIGIVVAWCIIKLIKWFGSLYGWFED